jgi:uncharacterized membrane protein
MSRAPASRGAGRTVSRGLLAAFFVASGVNHFVSPRFYRAIVPPPLHDDAKLVVDVSGVAEVLGGLGVLLPRTRRAAGAALVALLVAVFPANVYMAREPNRFRRFPRWALFARLPLQPLMIWWAWRATRD